MIHEESVAGCGSRVRARRCGWRANLRVGLTGFLAPEAEEGGFTLAHDEPGVRAQPPASRYFAPQARNYKVHEDATKESPATSTTPEIGSILTDSLCPHRSTRILILYAPRPD